MLHGNFRKDYDEALCEINVNENSLIWIMMATCSHENRFLKSNWQQLKMNWYDHPIDAETTFSRSL